MLFHAEYGSAICVKWNEGATSHIRDSKGQKEPLFTFLELTGAAIFPYIYAFIVESTGALLRKKKKVSQILHSESTVFILFTQNAVS